MEPPSYHTLSLAFNPYPNAVDKFPHIPFRDFPVDGIIFDINRSNARTRAWFGCDDQCLLDIDSGLTDLRRVLFSNTVNAQGYNDFHSSFQPAQMFYPHVHHHHEFRPDLVARSPYVSFIESDLTGSFRIQRGSLFDFEIYARDPNLVWSEIRRHNAYRYYIPSRYDTDSPLSRPFNRTYFATCASTFLPYYQIGYSWTSGDEFLSSTPLIHRDTQYLVDTTHFGLEEAICEYANANPGRLLLLKPDEFYAEVSALKERWYLDGVQRTKSMRRLRALQWVADARDHSVIRMLNEYDDSHLDRRGFRDEDIEPSETGSNYDDAAYIYEYAQSMEEASTDEENMALHFDYGSEPSDHGYHSPEALRDYSVESP